MVLGSSSSLIELKPGGARPQRSSCVALRSAVAHGKQTDASLTFRVFSFFSTPPTPTPTPFGGGSNLTLFDFKTGESVELVKYL